MKNKHFTVDFVVYINLLNLHTEKISRKSGNNKTLVNRSFLACLHCSAEELLLYPRRPRRHPHAKCKGKC